MLIIYRINLPLSCPSDIVYKDLSLNRKVPTVKTDEKDLIEEKSFTEKGLSHYE